MQIQIHQLLYTVCNTRKNYKYIEKYFWHRRSAGTKCVTARGVEEGGGLHRDEIASSSSTLILSSFASSFVLNHIIFHRLPHTYFFIIHIHIISKFIQVSLYHLFLNDKMTNPNNNDNSDLLHSPSILLIDICQNDKP